MRWALLSVAVLASACATFDVPAELDEAPFRARAEVLESDGIQVSAALLTPDELNAVFGLDLAAKGIEPVWLEIENRRDEPVHFLISGMDPEYFAPLEVGHLFRASFASERNERVSDHISSLAIDYRAAIPPGTSARGFAYTNDSVGAKVLDVDLVGDAWSTSMTLYVTDPTMSDARARVERVETRFSDPELVSVDEAGLRAALEGLPSCVETAGGEPVGPLNLVLIGELKLGLSAFQRRGYRFRPGAQFHAFQRPADSEGGKTARWVKPQPQLVHLWQTPLRFESLPVWIGHVSMPTGGRFGKGAGGIDPYVDRARDAVVEDLLYSQHVSRIGRVACKGGRRWDESIETDGLRWVLQLDERAIALDELRFFELLEAEPAD